MTVYSFMEVIYVTVIPLFFAKKEREDIRSETYSRILNAPLSFPYAEFTIVIASLAVGGHRGSQVRLRAQQSRLDNLIEERLFIFKIRDKST